MRWIVGRHGQSPRCMSVLYCALYVLDCGSTRECHPICVICVGLWVDVGMSPVCVMCWIVGRPGASPHGSHVGGVAPTLLPTLYSTITWQPYVSNYTRQAVNGQLICPILC